MTTQTGVAAAGKDQRVRVCYLKRGTATSSGGVEYRTYASEEAARKAARDVQLNGLPAEMNGGASMPRVDEAHILVRPDGEWSALWR